MLASRDILGILAVVTLWAAVGGCASWHRKIADKYAYQTVEESYGRAIGRKTPFSVDYHPLGPSQSDPAKIVVGDKTLTVGKGPVQTLTLAEAMEIAYRNSRSFQNRKESLFSEALAVSAGRRGWNWLELGGAVDAQMSETRIRKGDTTESGTGATGPTFTQRLATGAVVVLAVSLDAATDFLGTDGITLGSLIDLNVTQPLLQGAWNGVAYESQARAERDLIFSVYSFERFTQTFASGVVQDYYSVLQRRDELENEKQNIERLKQTLALTKVLADGGQVSRIQMDQAEQNLLNAQVRYERNRQTYLNSLDTFKLSLGVPVETQIELDYPGELEALGKAGPLSLKVQETDAVELALSTRPDVLTQRAARHDAERDIVIAADKFLPQLDASIAFSAASDGPKQPQKIRFDKRTQVNSLTLNYSLDQTDNRDNYRNALIDFERAKRDLDEFEDQVRIEVRQAYRTLLQSQRSYQLQLRSVEIAKRRRALASLQQKEGQASARDVLEAEDALRTAQNGLTDALISYTTTRLNFLASLGLLRVDEKGRLHERDDPFKFDRIQQRYRYVGR